MATCLEIEVYSVSELCEFVAQKLVHVEDCSEILRALERNRITGKIFLELTDEELQEMVRPIGDRKALKKLANLYKPQPVVHKRVCINSL